jgi:hypothetical protein
MCVLLVLCIFDLMTHGENSNVKEQGFLIQVQVPLSEILKLNKL